MKVRRRGRRFRMQVKSHFQSEKPKDPPGKPVGFCFLECGFCLVVMRKDRYVSQRDFSVAVNTIDENPTGLSDCMFSFERPMDDCEQRTGRLVTSSSSLREQR